MKSFNLLNDFSLMNTINNLNKDNPIYKNNNSSTTITNNNNIILDNKIINNNGPKVECKSINPNEKSINALLGIVEE